MNRKRLIVHGESALMNHVVSSKRKRLLIFHRNRLFRDCLANFIVSHRGHDATPMDRFDGDSIDAPLLESADILLLDLNLPNNLAVKVAQTVCESRLSTRIIVLVPDDQDRLIQCIAWGIHGCILERAPLTDLETAIEQVLRGDTFCSQELVSSMFSEISRFASEPRTQRHAEDREQRLTLREQDVLELLEQRKSNKQIASALSISLFTVKNHVSNILDKLNAENRVEAVAVARQKHYSS